MPPNNVLWNIIRWSEGEDRLVQKLRRINKEKHFGDGTEKGEPRRINCRQSRISPPLSRLCGPVCGFRREGKETPLTPIPAPV